MGPTDPTSASRRPVIIAGLPRAGTTWTFEVLSRPASVTGLLEPDSEGKQATAIPAKREAGRFPVLVPGERSERYRDLWEWILRGAPQDLRTRAGGWVLDRVRPDVRLRFLRDQHTFGIDLAGALAGPARKGPVGVPPGNRLVVKSVHAPLAIEWIADEFDVDVLILTRHPGSILASWLALDLNDRHVALEQQPRVRELAARWDVPLPGDDPVELAAWRIGVLVSALEESAQRHPDWKVRTHEELCIDTESSFRSLYDSFSLPWERSVATFLEAKNVEGKGFRTKRVASELPGNWRRRLTPEQVDVLARVLKAFPLAHWSLDDRDDERGAAT